MKPRAMQPRTMKPSVRRALRAPEPVPRKPSILARIAAGWDELRFRFSLNYRRRQMLQRLRAPGLS